MFFKGNPRGRHASSGVPDMRDIARHISSSCCTTRGQRTFGPASSRTCGRRIRSSKSDPQRNRRGANQLLGARPLTVYFLVGIIFPVSKMDRRKETKRYPYSNLSTGGPSRFLLSSSYSWHGCCRLSTVACCSMAQTTRNVVSRLAMSSDSREIQSRVS